MNVQQGLVMRLESKLRSLSVTLREIDLAIDCITNVDGVPERILSVYVYTASSLEDGQPIRRIPISDLDPGYNMGWLLWLRGGVVSQINATGYQIARSLRDFPHSFTEDEATHAADLALEVVSKCHNKAVANLCFPVVVPSSKETNS